jgi:hypothetical protein
MEEFRLCTATAATREQEADAEEREAKGARLRAALQYTVRSSESKVRAVLSRDLMHLSSYPYQFVTLARQAPGWWNTC